MAGGAEGECVLHLLFANDTILFCEAAVEESYIFDCCDFVFKL